jgi:putative ABC transport system permease protein
MLKNYLKIAWKILLRRKFFTGISLFGISFTLMVLMIVTAILDHNFGPKVPEVKIKRMLFAKMMELSGEGQSSTSTPSYQFLKRYVKTLKTPEMVTLFSGPSTKSTYRNDKRIDVIVRYTDEVFWDVYAFRFLEGRAYRIQELERTEPVAVISEKIRKEFFIEQDVVGQYLELENARYRVVGVVEDVSRMFNSAFANLWIPHTTMPHKVNDLGVFGSYRATILAHSRKDFPKIKEEYDQVLGQVQVPDPKRFDTIFCPLETKEEEMIRYALGMKSREKREHLFSLLIIGATLLFMTLPAINLVNINMSRIAERSSEIGIRKAFGATKFALTGQFIIENIILTLIGGVIGILLSMVILHILTQSGVIPYAKFTVSFRVFVYYLGLSLFFGCFSGVYPAYRMSKLHPVEALTGGRE